MEELNKIEEPIHAPLNTEGQVGEINRHLLVRLHELQPHKKYQANDIGRGNLFGDVFKDKCRYNWTDKKWYTFGNGVWSDVGQVEISKYAKDLATALVSYSQIIETDVLLSIYDKIWTRGKRNSMIEDGKDRHYIDTNDLDSNLDLFNCQNGTLNLKTFEFVDCHNPSDLNSKISNVIYNPKAKSERWEQFVDEIMCGDKEKVEYLQKVLGYALTGDAQLEICFILYGPSTRNGKSTLTEAFAYMLGERQGYATGMSPHSLTLQKRHAARPNGDIARLKGFRFVDVAEPPQGMKLDVALLKSLTGQDKQVAREVYKSDIEFVFRSKLFCTSNHIPYAEDETVYTSGRIQIIPFDRHFKKDDRQLDLKAILKDPENVTGMFNWCLEGLKKLSADGFKLTPPQSVIQATLEASRKSDLLGKFFDECMEVQDGNCLKADDVLIHYNAWCIDFGYKCESKGSFYADLRERNYMADTGTVAGITVHNVIKGYRMKHRNNIQIT